MSLYHKEKYTNPRIFTFKFFSCLRFLLFCLHLISFFGVAKLVVAAWSKLARGLRKNVMKITETGKNI